jgi:hypothetical protein
MANSKIVAQTSSWSGVPSGEPTVKDFISGIPVSERQMDWIAYNPPVDIGGIIDWVSDYGSAQLIHPVSMWLPDIGGPTGRVLLGFEEAFVLGNGVDSGVHAAAQMVRVNPAIRIVWSSPTVGDGVKTVRFEVSRKVIGGDNIDPIAAGSSTVLSPPVLVPTNVNDEVRTTLELGDISGGESGEIRGLMLDLHIKRKGSDTENDTFGDVIHLKRVEVR